VQPALAAPQRIVLTGSGGFVGSALAKRLSDPLRLHLAKPGWREAIAGIDFRGATVIHLAARVHDPRALAGDFDRDNVEKTAVLAEAAAEGGAARFVFAGTVKVHGEETRGAPFRPDSPPAPEDDYARSKWRAEDRLDEISSRTGLHVVVVRMPLVYGPGVGGNFASLLRLADSGAWLPLASIRNRRSLVHVADLVEALLLAATHPQAPGRDYIAAHPQAVSTPGLVTAIRSALGRPARIFPVPPAMLELAAAAAGMRGRALRLTRSLEVDPSSLVSELGWAPRLDLARGLVDTVAHWREGRP
jgi:nucleoside-diphosphate-sugar epimerase